MSNKPFFAILIAGTDTDAGKTIVTASLLRALHKAKIKTQAIKPLQTGVQTGITSTEYREADNSDAAIYQEAINDCLALSTDSEKAQLLAPKALQCLELATSPHLAAKEAKLSLTVAQLEASIYAHWAKVRNDIDCLLLEAAGGLFVPLNDNETFFDLFIRLNIPIILVGRNELGAINHFLLAINAINNHALPLLGLALSPISKRTDPNLDLIQKDNYQFLQAYCQKQQSILSNIDNKLPVVAMAKLPQEHNFQDWQILANCLEPFVREISKLIRQSRQSEELTEKEKNSHLENSNNLANVESLAREKDLIFRDHQSLWHPYTSAVNLPLLSVAKRSYSNRIVLENGKELIDGMSSWWAAIHGYNHPHLLEALQRQAKIMPHIMFGGLTHEPAISLAERLLEHLPAKMARIFFADSGSVAVEVAMKMALQYHRARGDSKRQYFLSPRGGYHGDTLGAMSVCDPETGMHSLFTGLLAQQLFMPRPSCRFDQDFDPASLDMAKKICQEQGDSIAAIILEPIVQGAGGMWFYHPEYLKGLEKLCQEYGILLILDEIATGFGRTGKFFAGEWAKISADIICCGKALSGGIMTLAATACSQAVAVGICQNGLPFMHGPTFMANPLACAVANASLDILESKNWQAQVAEMAITLKSGLASCQDLPEVRDVRVLGSIAVVEMERAVNLRSLQAFFVENGVWIRPFSNLIYLMPPYISSKQDLLKLCRVITKAIEEKRYC